MAGQDLTLLVAIAAGVISFLSPCVLPLVPAYLGQLTAIAAASASASGTEASDGARSAFGSRARGLTRWVALRHAVAYVAGFGAVFTLLGITATYAAGPLVDYLPILRQAGGVLLIVMGLNLAGILTIPTLERVWRPLEAGAARSVAGATGTISLGTPGLGGGAGSPTTPSRADRLAGRLVGSRGGWLASFGLGAIFAIGWTPCIGTILGGILGLAATSGTSLQGAVLLVGYTAGLGIPFLVVGALYDRAPALLRPFVRHGQAISLIGGLLVVAIGVAMLMDWLALLPRYFTFLSGV